MLVLMYKVNSTAAAVIAHLGRTRRISPASLLPYPGALSAFVLWKSLPRARRETRLIVQRSEHLWLWCGGFVGLPSAPHQKQLEVITVARSVPADVVRELLWAEAISPLGLSTRALPQWHRLVKKHLPEDITHKLFAPRGLNASSAARWLTRQTVAKHLRADHE